MAMSADRRECAAVHKIRVNARTEISTARREHGIYGDERGRLTNNKSKYSSFKSKRFCKVVVSANSR